MIIISHRRNKRQELAATPTQYGVEVDIRSNGPRLYIHHDAFVDGENFEEWLTAFRHNTLILNVKEEGLEGRLLKLMDEHGIDNFFFLDQSFPFLIKTARSGERRCALRVSEYESIDTAMTLQGQAEWIWVDCFNEGLWLTGEQAKRMQDGGFKLCLVSPELQGRTAAGEIAKIRELAAARGVTFEAVCTKEPAQWE